MSTLSRIGLLALAGVVSSFVAGAPARASMSVNGVTYSLTETMTTPDTALFDLQLSGTEGVGVNAFAFSQPGNFSGANAPSGFTYKLGGLDSTGCNGEGNDFFCFQANPGPMLISSSDAPVDLLFGVTLSSGSFAEYAPEFKIQWALGDSRYDLVSMTLCPDPTDVPEPVSMALLGTGLLGLGLVRRRRGA